MTKKTIFDITIILFLSVLIAIIYNNSNPHGIKYIGDDRLVDYSQSDSLMNLLRIQDSMLRTADSLKIFSDRRHDSLTQLREKQIMDSLLAVRKDSSKRVQDSLNLIRKHQEDSVKNANDFVKPVDIKIDFAKALYDKKYTFIDARDISDYNAGHIEGAVNIPYHILEQYRSKLESMPKDKVYITYCSSACDVSIDLAYAMARMGFKKIYIFHGGWDEWKAAGYPVN